jgi:hypothetical protein
MLYHKATGCTISTETAIWIRIAGYFGWKIQRRTSFTFGKYRTWRVGVEEKLMVAVDRLKTLIQRLASLGNVVTKASKIERIKDGLKCTKYKLLVVSMAMQPLSILRSINLFQ